MRPSLLKVSVVIISHKTEESGRAMVQHLKVHHCAVTRYETGGGLYLGKQHPDWLSCQHNLDRESQVKSLKQPILRNLHHLAKLHLVCVHSVQPFIKE